MLHVLINYNFTPEWVKNKDYLIYDRSDSKEWLKDFNQTKIIYTENIGQVDHDRLTYLVDNYDNLPGVFLLAKSNLFKSITPEEYEKVASNKTFTPLLTQHHRTYNDEGGEVCYYKDGMYYERNTMRFGMSFKYAETFHEWAEIFGLPDPDYIPFAPGGNYILTRETVHKHPKGLYAKMKDMLPYTREPAEAQFVERSYYLLWR